MNVKKLMISRAGKTWNTRPERLFDEYQRSRGLGLVQHRTLPFVAENRAGRLQRFDFQCDFLRPVDSQPFGFDIDFEVDGKGHSDKNDPWKDGVKNGQGLKVIHIPGDICHRRFWGYLDEQISRAILSSEAIVNIEA